MFSGVLHDPAPPARAEARVDIGHEFREARVASAEHGAVHPAVLGRIQAAAGIQHDAVEVLRTMLPHTIECLKSRQANLIGDDLIEDYVALDWLEWAGGGLRLTEVGRNLFSAMNRRSG